MVNKTRTFIFPIFFLTFFMPAESNTELASKGSIKKSANGTIHFAINVKNQQDARSNNSTNVYTAQVAKVPETTAKDSAILNKVSELWQENIKIQKQLQERGSQFIGGHKWYLLAAGLIGSYGLLAYFIMSGNSYLSDNTLWSSWHQELPLDQLLAVPQQQMTQELIREIQRRYTDSTSIADIVKPLGIFMVKIDQEEEQIKWYQTIYSWLLYLRLHKLVPMSQVRFSKISERLQRIAYYKNLFKSWTADYQLQQAERIGVRCPEKEHPDLYPMSQLLQIEMRLKTLNYWIKRVGNTVPRYN